MHAVQTNKMDIRLENELINDCDSIPIIVTSDTNIESFVKGYHAYKDLWKPYINEQLMVEMEPGNVVYKYAVCVKRTT